VDTELRVGDWGRGGYCTRERQEESRSYGRAMRRIGADEGGGGGGRRKKKGLRKGLGVQDDE